MEYLTIMYAAADNRTNQLSVKPFGNYRVQQIIRWQNSHFEQPTIRAQMFWCGPVDGTVQINHFGMP